MLELVATYPKRELGLVEDLRLWFRRRRQAREAERLRQLTAAREAIERRFREWLEVWDRLRELAAEGWSTPGYAQALLSEKAFYRALMAQHDQLRRESLPL